MADQKKVRSSIYLKGGQQLDVVDSAEEIQKGLAKHNGNLFIRLEGSFRSQQGLATAPVSILLSEISGIIDLENMSKVEVEDTKEEDIKKIQDKLEKKTNKSKKKK